MSGSGVIRAVFGRLLGAYGAQGWWPGDSPFEVMVGAILTQNTAWRNVEKALSALRKAGVMSPVAMYRTDMESLAEWLRPAGYYNVKARRLLALCRWLINADGVGAAASATTPVLRRRLLDIKGIGPETADAILLYAFGRPAFVIDAYTRRLFGRIGAITGDEEYEELAARFQADLPRETGCYNEYHALIVRHGKEACRSRPLCRQCCLADMCETGQA